MDGQDGGRVVRAGADCSAGLPDGERAAVEVDRGLCGVGRVVVAALLEILGVEHAALEGDDRQRGAIAVGEGHGVGRHAGVFLKGEEPPAVVVGVDIRPHTELEFGRSGVEGAVTGEVEVAVAGARAEGAAVVGCGVVAACALGGSGAGVEDDASLAFDAEGAVGGGVVRELGVALVGECTAGNFVIAEAGFADASVGGGPAGVEEDAAGLVDRAGRGAVAADVQAALDEGVVAERQDAA